nr:MAG TPA: hypothetical protein [Caudoviricetes sp.]DAQ46463.1 MAG TPA: hypothetical protein [Caudoviricetes sp.]
MSAAEKPLQFKALRLFPGMGYRNYSFCAPPTT